MASDEFLARIDAHLERGNEIMRRNTEAFERFHQSFESSTESFESFKARGDLQEERNQRFHDELMKRSERFSLALEARLADFGDQIRAQTEALYRVLDRLPPASD